MLNLANYLPAYTPAKRPSKRPSVSILAACVNAGYTAKATSRLLQINYLRHCSNKALPLIMPWLVPVK